MKLLITSLLLIALSACSGKAVTEGEEVIKIEQIDDKIARYYVTGRKDLNSADEDAHFIARRGLYTVGDTVWFSRRRN